jgi:hypothetical protein
MSTHKFRGIAAAALFTVALAGGPVSAAHATKNDGRYAKTVGSRFHLTGPSSWCGDTLSAYQADQSAANAAINRWDFAAANAYLDDAAKWKSDADSVGCAWPYAV